MSGKRSRFFRKQNTVSKKLIALTLATALAVMPMSAEGDVSVTIFPHFMKSLSVGDTHDINGGYGAGVKLSYAPNKYMDLFVEGDYLNLTLPNVDPITVMNGNVGIEYKIPISDRINLGVSAEAGGYKATYKANMTGLTGGASLSLSYKFGPTLSSETKTTLNHYSAGDTGLVTSAMVSPGLSVNLTEALQNKTKVKVNTKSISPVFPVLHSWYNDNSFATIEVKNEEDYDIEQVTVSFFQPLYMSQPKVCAVKEKVGKEESFDTDITAFFNERMLDLIEKTDTQATVTVKYVCLGKEKTLEYPMTIPVYDRNSMSWDDDRRAAAFVSSKDPAAMWYAKYISSIVHDNMRSGVAENIQYAMGIFETLDKFGLNYVIDPSSSYADNIGTASIDFLQFPYQTLMYRGGDCDDISILVCSLFEAVGIDTAFITIPGHIFMAFNSGLTVDEAKKEFSSMENFIVRDNEVWVPLEITLTDEGFNKAWRVGAREWNQADKNGTACLYKMRDSWKTYKPVSVPGAAIKFTMLEDNKIEDAFETGIVTWINHEISPMANEYKTAIAQTDSDEIINSLGALYARYGLFVKADDQFKKSRRRGYLPSLLNTANMYFSTKDYELALKWYKKVLETEPDNMLATLGVARCCYELELYDECDAAYAKIRSDSPQLAADYSYLGAFENKNGRSFSLSDRLGKTIWVNDFLDMREYDKTTLAMTEEEETASEDFSSNTDLIPPEELLASLPQGLLRPDSEVQPAEDKNTAVASAPKAKTPEDFGGEIFVGLVNEIAIRNTEKENYEESHSIESHIPLLVPDAQIAQSEDEESTELAIADTQEELEIPNPNVYESFDAVATSNEHSRHDDDDEKLFTSIPITSPKTKSETYIAQALDEPINEEPVHEEDSKPRPAEEFELATAPHTTEKPETEQVAVAEPIVKPQEIALASEPVNAEPTYQAESAQVLTGSINTPQAELATAVEPVET
uniref:tetratricopeptide repeat protein n=1 Tax=Treponema zioleckii TaxID=331680 RepID=UPI00168B9582